MDIKFLGIKEKKYMYFNFNIIPLPGIKLGPDSREKWLLPPGK